MGFCTGAKCSVLYHGSFRLTRSTGSEDPAMLLELIVSNVVHAVIHDVARWSNDFQNENPKCKSAAIGKEFPLARLTHKRDHYSSQVDQLNWISANAQSFRRPLE
jgi:hypothetical protein